MRVRSFGDGGGGYQLRTFGTLGSIEIITPPNCAPFSRLLGVIGMACFQHANTG